VFIALTQLHYEKEDFGVFGVQILIAIFKSIYLFLIFNSREYEHKNPKTSQGDWLVPVTLTQSYESAPFRGALNKSLTFSAAPDLMSSQTKVFQSLLKADQLIQCKVFKWLRYFGF
jgi:hypothetical protein